MNFTLLHEIRGHFGTFGREPEDLKEADSSLCLHWRGGISQELIRAFDFSLSVFSCFSQWNLFSERCFYNLNSITERTCSYLKQMPESKILVTNRN